MPFIDKLLVIEKLQNTIEQYGKIAPDVLRKINYKFRLDWNYYSNIIEGNSLTMQETRSIMVGNVTVDGKPIKDVMEMKGHDDIINDILKIGKSELNLSEKRIKAIHKGIMHEEDIAKQPFIGQWKIEPNYLYNYKKERFDFTAPADVADEMHKLINWLNTEKEKIARKAKDALHPIQLAFHFHIDYVTIHPFYDGNGRTARILTNLILISYGFPPVYVKDTEKEVYNQYLGEIQTYGGDTQLFYDFMAGLLIRSQQLVVDALDGKVIDEANDWQKKLQLLKLERNEDDVKEVKSVTVIYETVIKKIVPFLKNLVSELKDVDELFSSKIIKIGSGNTLYSIVNIENLELNINNISHTIGDSIDFYCDFVGFKRDKLNTFSVSIKLHWLFDDFKYYFYIDQSYPKIHIAKLYNNEYSSEEMESIINAIGNQIYKDIDHSIKHWVPPLL